MDKMIVVCGFNEFQQFNGLLNLEENAGQTYQDSITEFISCPSNDVVDISVTWSNVMIIKKNEIAISGFLNGELVKSKVIDNPFDGSVVQASGTRSRWLVVTSKGQCWEFKSNRWRSLKHMFPICHNGEEDTTTESYETSSDSSSSAERDGAIVRECCLNAMVGGSLYREDETIEEDWTDNEGPFVTKVICGSTLTGALTNEGKLYSLPNFLELPSDAVVKDIACGIEHGVALLSDGRVFTWGCGSRGQLGVGTLENYDNPVEVEALAGLVVTGICAGGWHTAVVTKDGDVYTWGWNKQGQLGHPCVDSKVWEGKVGVLAVPRAVDWPQGIDVFVDYVACGTTHTVARLSNGEIWGCGWNRWGQLGTEKFYFTDRMTKLDIPDDLKVTRIKCAAWNTILFCDDTK